jgi:succinate dehydrogenase hydrophobic anchor subunit
VVLPVRVINLALVGILLFFLITALFQWLWNITMPQVFNLKEITFWQAFRLLLMAGILFGGIGIAT